MKFLFYFFAVILFLLDNGSSGADTDDVSLSVMEGDSVTLNTGVQTNQQEVIKWYFNDTRIAQISGDLSDICTDVQCEDGDERFRDRLKLDNQTGSLTITHTTYSGLYELKIITSRSSSDKIFRLSVTGVSAAELYEVNKGESVTLDPGVIKNPNDSMKWYFNDILIAEITGDQSQICTDVQCKERFRDRLELDNQTGSLNITHTTNTHSGVYKLLIIFINSSFSITTVKRFSLSVIDVVPDSGLSSVAVAGIVVAVLLVLVVAAGVIYWCDRCHHRSHASVQRNPPTEEVL
ncbi:uncharacterized protein LOC120486601 [Pimephales promelas]|uniref:uncharacterized protein LOC120486601 n=1 Tax=Pimephales promelas TaxID=90988 RepID=UPI0019558252|nr:uncharacterized protein LOC120486601 [Pimephales promelas]